MQKYIYLTFLILILSCKIIFSQAGVSLTALPPEEAKEYSKPMATWFGSYFNSGTYYSADLPQEFQFKFSIIGSYIIIPESQQTFTPNPGITGYENLEPTATIAGSKGNVYLGPQGVLTYPYGFDVASLPAAIYQVGGSYFSTELLVRFFPKMEFNELEAGFWGVGLKHNISRWIKDSPFDISVQLVYNNFGFEYIGDDPEDYIKTNSNNFAINVHASKTFEQMFIVYGGLQYESSKMDLDYYFNDPNELYPQIADQVLSTSVDGDNNFRFTVGGAIKLSAIVFNIDLNVTSQFTIAGGISLQF
jgi:hypothetical protein